MEIDTSIVIKMGEDGQGPAQVEFENVEARAWVAFVATNDKQLDERMRFFGTLFKGSKGVTYKGEPVARKHFDEALLPVSFFKKVEEGYWKELQASSSGGAEAKNG